MIRREERMVDKYSSKKLCQIATVRLFAFFVQCLVVIHRKDLIRRLFISFSVTLMVIFLYSIHHQRKNDEEANNTQSSPRHIFDTNTSMYIPLSNFKQQSYHTVLLWTDLFSDVYWHQQTFFNLSTIIACSSMHLCQFTRDKRKLSQSSVVAFHLYDINRGQLPERISSETNNQSWIFLTGESPVNFYYQNPSFFPSMLDDYFDRSISYKYDSPMLIFSSALKPRTLSQSSSYTIEMQRERDRNNISLTYKKKPIVWIVSNCNTFSQREKYVEKLKEFISVDIYGQCGQSCSQDKSQPCQINLHEYYFYLSFENSRCNSYITEKFWNIILDDTHRPVPIVMGAPESDYERIAPIQSYIHINRFQTPEHLAKYLNDLISNPAKYLTYLRWREHMIVERPTSNRWKNLLCPLCQMAYEPQLSSHARLNFSTWYNPKTECHHDDVKLFRECKQVNLRDWMSWTHNVQCP